MLSASANGSKCVISDLTLGQSFSFSQQQQHFSLLCTSIVTMSLHPRGKQDGIFLTIQWLMMSNVTRKSCAFGHCVPIKLVIASKTVMFSCSVG